MARRFNAHSRHDGTTFRDVLLSSEGGFLAVSTVIVINLSQSDGDRGLPAEQI